MHEQPISFNSNDVGLFQNHFTMTSLAWLMAYKCFAAYCPYHQPCLPSRGCFLACLVMAEEGNFRLSLPQHLRQKRQKAVAKRIQQQSHIS